MSPKKILLPAMLLCSLSFAVKASAQTKQTDTLAAYRKQIDSLDRELMRIVGQRMQVVEKVGAYKVQHHMPALQQQRFDAVLQKNIESGKAVNLSADFVTELMNAIHKESLRKETALGTFQAN